MGLSHKQVFGVSVFVAILGVGFIVASFATDHWIDSDPVNPNNSTNRTAGSATKNTANFTFGLFTGYRSIDFSLGQRQDTSKIQCDSTEQLCAYVDTEYVLSNLVNDYKNQTGENKLGVEWFGLFSFPMYIATLVFLVLSVIWGFLAIGFGIFNVFGRPIETITGPSGLYVWNVMAFACTIAAIGVYLGLYFSQLKANILNQGTLMAGFTSKDLTHLDYSFYFVVVAAGVFIINVLILCTSGQKCSCSYYRSGEKEVDNGMILY